MHVGAAVDAYAVDRIRTTIVTIVIPIFSAIQIFVSVGHRDLLFERFPTGQWSRRPVHVRPDRTPWPVPVLRHVPVRQRYKALCRPAVWSEFRTLPYGCNGSSPVL